MERFGGKLHILRQRQGLTVRQLGERLGVSGPYVVQMEQGQKIPNVAMVIKIADLFGITADQLIRDEFEVD